jgi:hypothetical protein
MGNMTMAKNPNGGKDTYALQSDLDALRARVSTLEQALKDTIKEDETVTIKKTCHIAKLKAVSVSSKKTKRGASAVSRLKKMGK